MYADDMTVYIHPCGDSLKNVLRVIREFYHLSGLKISVSKTKVIWFGNEANSESVLCHDENIVWDNCFTLLGIYFRADLTEMDQNYFEKTKDVEKLLNSWRYRHLSPYGKIVIIKTLALSKLSHVAIVVPNLSKLEIKKFEKICFNFLWSNKSSKVCKDDTYMPPKQGRLGMVDIEGFWQSFKCSWIRCLMSTESFWPSILQLELSRYNTNLNELLFFGPSKLLELSKCVENKFWSNVLISVSTLQKEASYSNPESFYMFPIWNNPLFKNGRRVLYSSNFRKGSQKIQQVPDFYLAPGVLLSLQQINKKFRTNIKATQLLKFTMRSAQLWLISILTWA